MKVLIIQRAKKHTVSEMDSRLVMGVAAYFLLMSAVAFSVGMTSVCLTTMINITGSSLASEITNIDPSNLIL